MTTLISSQDYLDVTRARNGSDQAFTSLVERYQNQVYNLCYRMLGEQEIAEDATQESFLRAYKNIERFDLQRPFLTWLLSIAAHYCIDTLRRRKYSFVSIDHPKCDEESQVELVDIHAINPEQALEKKEEAHCLQKILGSLNNIDKAAIVLRYWYGLSDSEIAKILNISKPAVKSRLYRARNQIGHQLENNAGSATTLLRSSFAQSLPAN